MNLCEQSNLECEHRCEVVGGQPQCICLPGYELSNNQTCIDIDECSEDNGNCFHICTNTPGSYHCSCKEGWRAGSQHGSCEDINECGANNNHGPCTHFCENTPGSYHCTCPKPLILSSDGHRCVLTEVDESSPDTPQIETRDLTTSEEEKIDCAAIGGCSHTCLLVRAGTSVLCTCPPGFQLGTDWKTCEDFDECEFEDVKCPHEEVCINTLGSYRCAPEEANCPSGEIKLDNSTCVPCEQTYDDDTGTCSCEDGYLLEGNYRCVDENECLEDPCDHICTNIEGSYTCSCREGYELDEEETCIDIDKCKGGVCSQGCTNTEGSYRCTCEEGYELEEDLITCRDVDECAGSHPCSQVCKNTLGNYSCQCGEGYLLAEDGTTCEDVDECLKGHDCSQICHNLPGSYFCACEEGYELSENKTTCHDIDECSSKHNCSQVCENIQGGFICSCEEGYQLQDDGVTCEEEEEEDYEEEGSGCFDANCSQLCDETDDGPVCRCEEGYRLLEDESTCEDVDECQGPNNCTQGCFNTEGSYTCSCKEGYTLLEDGTTCEDVNECLGEHLCSHDCHNTLGGYTCSCPEGYLLSPDQRDCQDIDECPGNCTQGCMNEPGSFHCTCDEGFQLLDDLTTCTDINECDLESVNCTQICTNTQGSYSCSCQEGFTLQEDGFTCSTCEDGYVVNNTCHYDYCGEENGGCDQICTNSIEGPECSCEEGFDLQEDSYTCAPQNITCDDGYLLLNDTCVFDHCHEDNGGCDQICENSPEGPLCHCEEGLKILGKKCVDPCVDAACSYECVNGTCICPEGSLLVDGTDCELLETCSIDNGGCSHDCDDEEGIKCSCPEGYLLEDGKTCLDVDECIEDNGNCSQICLNEEGSHSCDCEDGFHLDEDQRTCLDVDECLEDNGNCSQVCVNREGSHFCHCEEGFHLDEDGKTCLEVCGEGFQLDEDQKTCEDIDECLEDNGNCSQICLNGEGSHSCECEDGFHLDEDGKTCLEVCGEGFQLDEDQRACLDIDECLENNGNCSQMCLNEEGSHFCECEEGFHLDNDLRTCLDVDECLEENGNCSQICLNEEGSHSCSCEEGFHLDEDEKTCIEVCGEGFQLDEDQKTCRDIDECLKENGNCSQICLNEEGSHSCSCREGFHLDGDWRTCLDVDECLEDNGNCSQVCLNREGFHSCRCEEGYHLGEDQRTCLDIDECLQDNGNCSHFCVNTEGSFHCTCPKGYRVEDKICQDIDECLEGPCEHSCVNIPGSYRCECRPGYALGEDLRCHDIDECQYNNGYCSHICENHPGSYRCLCPEGYILEASEKFGQCIDVNECAFLNGNCSHYCQNTPGSYSCSCPRGYSLSTSSECHDDDECFQKVDGCQHFCTNTPGSFYCSCREGYHLSVDGKSCQPQINTCPPFQAPFQGRMRCLNPALEDGKFPIGAKCAQWCDKGFKLSGTTLRSCLPDGTWGEEISSCIRVSCPRLPVPTHGRFLPATCISGKSHPGDLCRLSCRRGYRPAKRLIGRQLTCLNSLEWSPDLSYGDIRSLCVQDFPRPVIKCPSGGEFNAILPRGERSMYVQIPRPETNVDWWKYVRSTPSWGMQLGTTLTQGHYEIIFEAWSPVKNTSSSCSLIVNVQDVEPPRVLDCPKSMAIKLYPGQHGRVVRWREPIFIDNVQISKVECNRKSGEFFLRGLHQVIYEVFDNSLNKANCSFSIKVQAPEVLSEYRSPHKIILVCPSGIHYLQNIYEQKMVTDEKDCKMFRMKIRHNNAVLRQMRHERYENRLSSNRLSHYRSLRNVP